MRCTDAPVIASAKPPDPAAASPPIKVSKQPPSPSVTRSPSFKYDQSGVNRALVISAFLSIIPMVAAGWIVINHKDYDDLLYIVVMSYQIIRYLMYHSILYQLYRCFAVSCNMPYRKRSLYMMLLLLFFSSILRFFHSILSLNPNAEFNQDMGSALNSLQIVIVLLVTTTLIVPWLRRLSRLMLGQAKDNKKATKLRVIATDQNMMKLEFMYTVTRFTNLVVWCNTTSLSIELFSLCTDIDDIEVVTVIGVYAVGIIVICLSTIFLYDLPLLKGQQNRCCLCCGHCWSRCCTTASKRAIEDSMVRELCWILHGETCAELQDVQKKHDARKRASVTDKIGSKGSRSRSGENMYDKNQVHSLHSPTSRTGTESQMIQIKNSLRSLALHLPAEQTPPPPPGPPPPQESQGSDDYSDALPLGVTMRMEQWYQNEPGASKLNVLKGALTVEVELDGHGYSREHIESERIPRAQSNYSSEQMMRAPSNYSIRSYAPSSEQIPRAQSNCSYPENSQYSMQRTQPPLNRMVSGLTAPTHPSVEIEMLEQWYRGEGLETPGIGDTAGGSVQHSVAGSGPLDSYDVATPDIEPGPGCASAVPHTPQSNTVSARL